MWRVYLLSAVIACIVGAATAFITVQLTKTTGAKSSADSGSWGVLVLEGEEDLGSDIERVVYYKTPFASPPHLTTTGTEQYKITEQKAESFKLQRPMTFTPGTKLKWKAEGQPVR